MSLEFHKLLHRVFQILERFPYIIFHIIVFPLDKPLFSLTPSVITGIYDTFDLIFFVFIFISDDDIRYRRYGAEIWATERIG
jgi:hypothetical protein